MSYEELQQLPPDTIIKVRMNYQYSVDEVTPQIWEFFLSHGAEIEDRSNDKITRNEIHKRK